MDESRPLFLQIAESLESAILEGSLAEEEQAPSTNELAAFHRINPATAAKGVNQLVVDGVLYKRRGIGMFVSAGARERIVRKRRKRFAEQYVTPMLAEAARLGIDLPDLIEMIESESKS
jgi:DNA-binding transcriptional regulator YhcF (GntR family)